MARSDTSHSLTQTCNATHSDYASFRPSSTELRISPSPSLGLLAVNLNTRLRRLATR